MKMKCYLLLHPFTRERKNNENAKKNAKERKSKRTHAKKTKAHIFKNEYAYFQERRRINNENEDANSRKTMST